MVESAMPNCDNLVICSDVGSYNVLMKFSMAFVVVYS